MNNSENEVSRLKYPESFFSAAVITVLSLFCQWLNWFAFEKLDYPWWAAVFITPVILCVMYHFVQLDAGCEGNFSRVFFFIFSVLVPFLLSLLLTVILLLNADEGAFDITEKGYSFSQTAAVYAGRITLTSLFMLIFSAIDVPLLRAAGGKRISD